MTRKLLDKAKERAAHALDMVLQPGEIRIELTGLKFNKLGLAKISALMPNPDALVEAAAPAVSALGAFNPMDIFNPEQAVVLVKVSAA